MSIPEMGIQTSMLEAAVMEPADRVTPEQTYYNMWDLWV